MAKRMSETVKEFTAKREFDASTAFKIDADLLKVALDAGDVKLEKSEIKIKDEERGVSEVTAYFEELIPVTQAGIDLLVGGDDKDKDGKVTKTALQKVAEHVKASANLRARMFARNLYLEAYGTVDHTARIARMVENFMKMGLSKAAAENAVQTALEQQQSENK